MSTRSDTLTEIENASGWRGSREVWLHAAKQAFLDSGLDAVKIQPLAASLNLSRASFYWFFKDRKALLDALLEDWQAKNTGAFVAACDAYAESIAEAMLNLIVVFHDEDLFEPQLDFAVRGWAHQSDEVMARVNQEDEVRLDAIKALFLRFGFDPGTADVRARAVYLVQIGYISMQVREDQAVRMSRVPGYVQTFCDCPPTEGELARFHARLKFTQMSADRC
ncbi:TetR/AcrR family transcriptional regulator [Paracoccus aurantiacus]|uniref:TetR/AcrR family transcriptional regulator n=1 Tax=Paracoccus aurantiacus TaxID=2599412 RepID=A0A5C6S8G5_9RHOB|nr:TetR/AcrR family transcriptional regulator [Paracoccus aurantiacus]TXB70372.1 TetR/AcrR family transcriptional regulator [Paracoccus aurantiacus]